MESYNNNLLTKPRGNRYAHFVQYILPRAYVDSFILYFFSLFVFFFCNRNVPTIAVVHCYEPPWKPARIIRGNKIGRDRQYRRNTQKVNFLFYALVFSRLHIYKDIYPLSVNKIKFHVCIMLSIVPPAAFSSVINMHCIVMYVNIH